MYVTRHATARIRERLGVPKKAALKIAERSYESGIPKEEITGSLRGWLDQFHDADDIRILSHCAFIFCNATLITVITLPYKYHATADKIARRNRHA